MAKKKYYAVKKGVKPGIYTSWPDTEAQVKGYPGAQFKGFATESEALQWLASAGQSGGKPAKKDTKISSHQSELKDGEIAVYTDGGAIGNPGPGGYGVVILSGVREKELCAGYRHTTNNRMELMACIAALRELGGCAQKITLYSDSSYVVNGITKGWATKWRKSGWVKADGKPVINQDLWQELLQLSEKLDIAFRWVKGHAGHPLNERCDEMAVKSARGSDLLIDRGYE